MKSPPVQYTDDEAHRLVEEFIAGETSENEELVSKLVAAEE